MDIVFSNSTLLFKQQPLVAPVRTVTVTHRQQNIITSATTTTTTPSKNQLLFGSRTNLSLKSYNHTLPRLAIRVRCGASSGITEITESEFPNTVLKSERPVLVEFVANWCGPCRLVAPAVEWLAQFSFCVIHQSNALQLGSCCLCLVYLKLCLYLCAGNLI
ncbi:hypothetical protein CICLE_v10032824mg [Citrus x clementina]|uniref:Thioredoxin domain-containing protein n=1 Tax=Citrus clementina TaxID=85681 RepID=V4TC45_CITCL|nr:hypothetical protein CICLE_v10032824mg [Citrus x clementina]